MTIIISDQCLCLSVFKRDDGKWKTLRISNCDFDCISAPSKPAKQQAKTGGRQNT